MASPFAQLRSYQRYMRWQGYQGVPIERFTGLDLRDAPDETGCLDCLNVDFSQLGRMRSRDGYAVFTSAAALGAYHSLAPFYKTDGTKQLIAAFGGASGAVNALNTSGGIVAAQSAANSTFASVARFAAPGSEHAYVAVSGSGAATVYRWDGSAWSTPAWTGTAPTGRHLAVTPWDNRLVNARRNGSSAGDSVSTVFFSGAGSPTSFGANDYEELSPGDGEEILALAAWGNNLFVFKATKFFVFFGTHADGGGNPVFDYRTVTSQGLAGGAGGSAYRAIAVAPQGIYFANRRGIWLTSGGPAQLVSRKIDPIFTGQATGYGPDALNQAHIDLAAMVWADEKLWFAYPAASATTNDHVLRYDPVTDDWTIYDFPASALASFRIGSAEEVVFGFSGAPITLKAPASPTATLAAGGTLTVGQRYYYKVTALNAVGETTPSAEVSATPIAAPTAPTINSIDEGESSGYVTSPATYYYKVVAYNNAANSAASAENSIALQVGGEFGPAVTAVVRMTLPANTKIRVYRGTNPGAEDHYADFTSAQGVPAGGGSYTLTDQVIDSAASQNINWNGGSPPSATPAQSVTVAWTATAGVTGYRVYRGTTAGGESVYFAPGNVLTFTDTGGAGTGGSPPGSNTATTAGFDVGRHSSAYTADGGNGTTTGAAINSRYRAGFIQPSGGAETRVREAIFQGTGTVTWQGSVDWGALDAGQPVTMPAAPAVGEGRARAQSYRGRNFSWQLSASAAWALQRLELMTGGARGNVEE